MYKVFIDQKPILIVSNEDLSTKFETLHIDDIINVPEDIWSEPFVNSDPLQIVCLNPETEFNRIFSDHTLIEAAGGIVRSDYGYLIIRRNGLWDIPKGKIDKGEAPEDAAVREIEEECGIESPKIEDSITETYHVYRNRNKAILKKTYWYFLSYHGPEHLTPQKNEGITDAVWMSQQQMFAIIGNTYGSINEVLDVYKKQFLD
jgi:ADP-ribose pyrophosphatase YjhB (NUDIX family)